MMQILRYPAITSTQFLGATGAFWDTLTNTLSLTLGNLQKLAGRRKGAAFAYEMEMDKARYGALIVLERWGVFVQTFGPHIVLDVRKGIIGEAPARIKAAEDLLRRANQMMDAAEEYSDELLAAAALAFDTVRATFAEERQSAEQMALLGPMLPEDYEEARRLFMADLNAR
jgi:hypothetical protein